MSLSRSFFTGLGCVICLCTSANPRKPLNNLGSSDYGYYKNHASSTPWFQSEYDLDKPLNFGFAISLLSMDARVINSGSYISGSNNYQAEVSKFSPSLGMHAVMDWRLLPQLSLRAMLGPSFGTRQMSFYNKDNGEVETDEVESVLLEMPILFKYKAIRVTNNRPYLLAGCTPYLDLNAGKRNADGFFIERKPFDLRLDIGMGIDFYRPFYKFATEFRFSFGLTNIFKDNTASFENDPVAIRKIQSISGLYSNMFILTFLFE